MSARWSTRLVHLYPPAWRTRYEDEVLALLEQRPPSPRDYMDLLCGALDAHLHGDAVLGKGIPVSQRIRLSEIAIFCGFVIFGVGFLGLVRLPDPTATWHPAVSVHPELGILYNLVVAAAYVSFLAVVAGGTPIVLSAIKQAWHERRRDVLTLLGIATALGVLFLLYSGVVYVVTSMRPGQGIRPLRPADIALSLIWLAIFGLCIVAIPLLASVAIVRGPISERVVRFALLPGAVVTGAMALGASLPHCSLASLMLRRPRSSLASTPRMSGCR